MLGSSVSRLLVFISVLFVSGVVFEIKNLVWGHDTIGAVIFFIIYAGIFAVSLYTYRQMLQTLARISKTCDAISSGNFEPRVTPNHDAGAFGKIIDQINNMIDRMDGFVRESGATMHAIKENRFYRKILMDGMVGSFNNGAELINDASSSTAKKLDIFATITTDFDAKSTELVQGFLAAADQMERTSKGMKHSSSETSQRSNSVAAAAEQASVNMQTVASAVEELSNSVKDISEQVNTSTKIANEAVQQAEKTNQTIATLSDSAREIDQVVTLISEIAEKTNLLALNATIEAARAGDAGKGFAVVAGEVKNLAGQTAKATEEITSQVKNMQNVTKDAVDAIESIRSIISQINEAMVSVSSAVEEQTAVTGEIARNTSEAAQGASEVTENIANVSEMASQTGANAQQVLDASEMLSTQSDELKKEIDKVLSELKKAV